VGAARALLEHGVDANARDAKNATPLHLAVYRPSFNDHGHPDVVQLLLQHSADVHARDDEGRTPFMRATERGHHDIMQLLLEHGAEDHRSAGRDSE
jgi:ankyrin repeat protein